jgi:fibronectin-binding autotransporter adhesin
MHNANLALGLAVVSVTAGVDAAPVNWAYNGATAASNSWGSGSSWSPADPAFDGTEDVVFTTSTISTGRTLTPDGNRTINSLTAVTATNNFKYTVNPGTGGVIKLLSGSMTINGNGTASARPIALTNSVVQIGDGVTAVTTATWDFKNTSTKSAFEMGAIRGIAGTVVSLIGDNGSAWAGNSSDFHGELQINQNYNYASGGIKLELISSNALGGTGSLVVSNAVDNGAGITNFHLTSTNQGLAAGSTVTTTHAMSIRADVKTAIAVGVFNDATRSYVGTINGNLTGTGDLEIGYLASIGTTAYPNGTLIVAGDANTLSGDVSILTGAKLRLDGTWTGAGNLQIGNGQLQGSGTLGMASGKVLTVGRTSGTLSANTVSVIPATNGTIGTLTIGTEGNSNTVSFTGNAAADRRLLIDIDGLLADRLTVKGNLVIDTTRTFLDFNILSEPTAAQYVVASWTGSLTGAFATVSGIPAGYQLQYTSNQLLLVNPSIPEPTSLAGLALCGGVLVGRRRSH